MAVVMHAEASAVCARGRLCPYTHDVLVSRLREKITAADVINMVIYVTPAGTIDEGGIVQPAYLNFDAELLAPPAGGLKGIIGQGYHRMALPTAVADEDDFKFHGELTDRVTH